MRVLHRLSNNRGDTIVEVLIALMIISLILVGAYNVSSRSTREVRTSQEHSTLLLLLQGQVEQVRSLAREASDTHSGVFAFGNSSDPTHPVYFCINSDGQPQPFDSAVKSIPVSAHVDLSLFPDDCKNIDNLYAIAVTYDNADNRNTFRFYGSWDTLGGGKGSEQLNYRVYPGGSTNTIIGAASIGTRVCTIDPATGDCVVTGPKTGPVVPHWGTSFTNLSVNPDLKVIGCEWNFGDGVIEKSPPFGMWRCEFGKNVGHVYTPPNPLPPDSVLCNPALTPDTVITLTMFFENGAPATTTATKHIPVCYPDY